MKANHAAPRWAFLVVLGASASVLGAQQSMQNMQGMAMSPQQTAPPKPAPKAKPAPKPNRTQNQPDAMPGDMQGMKHDTGNAAAEASGASEQNSVEQQAGQGDANPGAGSDPGSVTVPVQELQEPEAIGFRTGQDLPAPELLGKVADRESMTVENFLDLAEKNNPTLAEAQRNVDRSNAQARQQGLPPDPVVGYSGDHIRGGSYHAGEEGAFFSQVFVLGHKLALRRDIYLAEGHADRFAVEVQRARIHDDVGRAFFHTLAMQEIVAIRDRLLKVALDAETNAHELERVGQADASDVLSAEINAEQAKSDFEEAQRMYLAGFAELAADAGQGSLAPHPLTGKLVEPPTLDAMAMAGTDVDESPYTRVAQSNVAVAEARLKDAQRERVPNLNVKAGEWYSGEDVVSGNYKAGWESFAEAGVQLPLWNRNQGNIEAAKALVDRAHQDVERARLWTRGQAEAYAQQYLSARATAERYGTEMLPRARRAYQLEVTKYQQMAQSYPHVITAQHTLFTLQLGYVDALDREWHAALALQNYALMNGLEFPIDVGEDNTTMNLPTGGSQ